MKTWIFGVLFLSSVSTFTGGSTQSDWEKRLTERLSEFQSCQDQKDENSPCNRFVGRALSDVYGIDDFKDPGKPGEYISANLIETYVVTHNDLWVLLGDAGDQKVLNEATTDANQGHAVIAVEQGKGHGHVALVLPGAQTYSSNWKLQVPSSAAFFLGNPKEAYVKDKLSKAFSTPSGVRIFAHEK